MKFFRSIGTVSSRSAATLALLFAASACSEGASNPMPCPQPPGALVPQVDTLAPSGPPQERQRPVRHPAHFDQPVEEVGETGEVRV